MKRLLPDIYWSPSGRHGIIDTGKTIEFWLKDLGKDGQYIDVVVEWIILNNIYATDDKGQVPFKLNRCKHYVTIEKDKESDKAFVFLHFATMLQYQLGEGLDEDPTILKENSKYLVGTIPSNSHIDHIIMKNIKHVKSGRVYKIQYGDRSNLKVIFPYGVYKFSKEDDVVVDYSMKKDKRFDDLVFGE